MTVKARGLAPKLTARASNTDERRSILMTKTQSQDRMMLACIVEERIRQRRLKREWKAMRAQRRGRQ